MKKYRIPKEQVQKIVVRRVIWVLFLLLLAGSLSFAINLGKEQEQDTATFYLIPIMMMVVTGIVGIISTNRMRTAYSEMQFELTANEILYFQGAVLIKRIAFSEIRMVTRLKNKKLLVQGSSEAYRLLIPCEVEDLGEIEFALLPFHQEGAVIIPAPNPMKWYVGFGVIVALIILIKSTEGTLLSKICFGILTVLGVAGFIAVQTRKNLPVRWRVLSLLMLAPLGVLLSNYGNSQMQKILGNRKTADSLSMEEVYESGSFTYDDSTDAESWLEDEDSIGTEE